VTEKENETAGTPRWVKVFGLVAFVLVVLIVVMLIAGRGGHGPSRHATGDNGFGYQTGLPTAVTRQQP
jgi:hypothetical protein